MITNEKPSMIVNAAATAPPSYDSVVPQGQTIKDEKQALPTTEEAPAYTASSSSKPDAAKGLMTEAQCMQSGGHEIHTEYFQPGGPMAIAATVVVAMWKRKPVFCERCHKDLYEEDLQVIWEKMEETCGQGKRGDKKGKACGEGGGFYDRRCGKGKQNQPDGTA